MRKQKLLIVICAAFLFLAAALPVSAEVSSLKEPVGPADSIYVAGNPDYYPVEYYNPETGCYEGMIPELLKIISEETGLNFTYVSSGEKNQQERLAKNGQVEIVSAYLASDETIEQYLVKEKIILSLPVNGKSQDICLAFTKIASDELINTVTASIDKIPESQLMGITLSYVMEHDHGHFPLRVFAALSVTCLFALMAAIFLFIKLYQRKKQGLQDKMLDLTTGIGNKAYFVHCFETLISDQNRELYYAAYIAFDISHFNQYYGQQESENILRFASDVLKQNADDKDILARITGGGFGLIFQSLSLEWAKEKIEGQLSQLNEFSQKYEKGYVVKFCAGIYSMIQSDRSCEKVLYNALQGYLYAVENDLSMAISNEKLLMIADEQLQLQRQIESAFKNHEFKLYLQFIVDKTTKKIIGAEALSRWQHPQKGLLPPGRFVERMEKLGRISELDFYVFEETCKQLESWKNEGRGYLMLSCNFTRLSISLDNFMDKVNAISQKYHFEHANLVMEITEDIAESNKENAFRNILECKKAGYQIALDDFGDGYTSFSNLCDYHLDYIKIDKTIIKKAETPEGKVLLNGMITLGHNLGIKVLCEGIETEQQNDMICQTKCDLIQGYYYSRAIPQEEIDLVFH